MFSVLVIADDAGFFRRRRLFRAPQVRDVRVYGGLPFREIISARRRGKINRAAICEAAGRCSGTMLLPEDIAPGGGIDEPDLSFSSTLRALYCARPAGAECAASC